jgi:hypothetical protein
MISGVRTEFGASDMWGVMANDSRMAFLIQFRNEQLRNTHPHLQIIRMEQWAKMLLME